MNLLKKMETKTGAKNSSVNTIYVISKALDIKMSKLCERRVKESGS